MSSLPKHQPENICYRCRDTTQMDNELLRCSECTQLWHYKCLSSPQELMPKDEWICPRHQKAVSRNRYRFHYNKFTENNIIVQKSQL